MIQHEKPTVNIPGPNSSNLIYKPQVLSVKLMEKSGLLGFVKMDVGPFRFSVSIFRDKTTGDLCADLPKIKGRWRYLPALEVTSLPLEIEIGRCALRAYRETVQGQAGGGDGPAD